MQFRIIRGGCMLVSALAIAAPAQGAGSGHFEALSQRLLEHVKYHEPCQDELAALKSADRKLLFRELSTDGARKAFWINLYNALAQLQIDRDPSLYQDRRAFFNLQNLTVAGRSLSLDDIEHRLRRRYNIIGPENVPVFTCKSWDWTPEPGRFQ